MWSHKSPDHSCCLALHHTVDIASCAERDRSSTFSQVEQSLGIVFMETGKDELMKSHGAASVEKGKEGKEKCIQSRRTPKILGATLNDLTADMAAIAHEGWYSHTERYQPSLSLFGRAEKKRDVSCSYFTASEVTQVGSREREGV